MDMDDMKYGNDSHEKQYNVSMVDRAMKIMDYLVKSEHNAGISQLAKHLELPKANVFRIVTTLEKWGMVERDPLYENEYKLGKTLLVYGQKVKKDMGLLSVAKPIIKKMAADLGETVNIGILHENQIIILHSEQGEVSVLVSILPPTCSLNNSSLGKIFLANMSESENIEYFAGVTREGRTVNTITSYDDFFVQREQILKNGYSIEREEWEYGLSCIAVPIKDKSDKLIAAVSVSGPTTRMERKGFDKLLDRMKSGSEEIMQHL